MTMRRGLFAAGLVILSWHIGARSASSAGRLDWSLYPPYTDPVVVPVPTGTFRLYEASTKVDLVLLFSNATDQRVLIDQQGVRRGLTVRFVNAPAVPVAIDWSPDALLRTSASVEFRMPATGPRLALDPGDSVGFELSIRRSDGQRLAEGLHRISYELPDIAAILSSNGGPFSDKVLNGVRTLGQLDVRAPTSSSEVSRMHQLAALRAIDKGATDEALLAYQRAVADEPSNGAARMLLAQTHFRLRQYREARLLFSSLAAEQGENAAINRGLVLSYLGEQDDSNAARVLRDSGIKDSEIPGELSKLRATVRQAEILETERQSLRQN